MTRLPDGDTETPGRARQLTGTRTIASSTFWNLVGRAGPIWIALLVTPRLVNDLGVARWGVFTIALSLVGIFGIFDFGIGRSLTRTVAELVGVGDEHSASSLVVTGMLVLGAFGTLGGFVAAAGARFWVLNWLHIEASQQHEVLISFYTLALSAPFVILTGAMWGVIAVYQRFRAANLIGVPLQSLYYIGPLLVLQVWNSLIGVMLVLLGCRVVSTGIYWWLCRRVMPSLRGARPDLRGLTPVLKLGGWMTVSNISWPVLMYADRFVIASVLTAAGTAYYTTPFDVVARLCIIPIAIMTSVFPAMAVSFRTDPEHTATLFRRSMLAIATSLLPACLLVVSFNTELMTVWLGPDFAARSAPLLRWLIVGTLITSVDGVAAGLIDAVGRPDLNAKLSLAELVLSIPILLALLSWLGLEGAAIAWVVRCGFDFLARLMIAARCYPPIRPAATRAFPPLLVGVGLLVLPWPAGSIILRLGADLLAVTVYLAVLLRFSVTRDERTWLMNASAGILARARFGMKQLRSTGSV